MNSNKRYYPEVRERAARLVLEHESEYESQWAAIGSVASKIGCTAERCESGRAKPSAIQVAATA